MGRVDRWWNERFPPYSWARLAFGIAVIPFLGLIWYVVNDEVFTWGRYIAVTLMTQVFLAVTYSMARSRRDEFADAEAAATGPITWRIPEGEPVPPEIQKEQRESAPKWQLPWRVSEPAEDAPSELQREALAGLYTPKRKPRVEPRVDFIASFVIAWATFVAVLIMMMPEPVGTFGIAMSGVVALVFTVALTFRYSVLVLVGVCLLLGYPMALIARAFFYILSFFGDQGSIWGWWLICSALLFTFIGPPWYAIKRNRRRIERLGIPNWVTTSLVAMVMIVCAGMASYEGSREIAAASPRYTPPPALGGGAVDGGADAHFGTITREEATLRLYYAWKNGDRAAAKQVAHTDAVNALLALPFDPAARPLGCATDDSHYVVCVIRRSNDLLVMYPQATSGGRFYIRYFEEKPLDHPLDYSQPATPTATP